MKYRCYSCHKDFDSKDVVSHGMSYVCHPCDIKHKKQKVRIKIINTQNAIREKRLVIIITPIVFLLGILDLLWEKSIGNEFPLIGMFLIIGAPIFGLMLCSMYGDLKESLKERVKIARPILGDEYFGFGGEFENL